MSGIKIIQGEIFKDHRGQISSLNNFDFEGVERFYIIHHPDKSVIRGWHGHKHEQKWFYCIKGSFDLAFVQPDDWENPSKDLKPEIFTLDENDSKVLCLPMGYANCIKANCDGAALMVFSGKKYDEALEDSWRYDSSMWVDWAEK